MKSRRKKIIVPMIGIGAILLIWYGVCRAELFSAYVLPHGRFVEAQKRVAAFMKDNQDEALQIVAEELDLDEEAVREMYACYDFSMDVTDEDKKGFQKTADFMPESGMIEEELNVNSLFL